MTLEIKFFQAGYCTHPEAIVIQGGKWKNTKFPSLFALISHPSLGVILYDTGYTNRFFDLTRSFPFNLYSLITPVYLTEEETAFYQLQQQNINAEDVNYIIISHFHADHIGGLRDFPNAQFICFQSAYETVKNCQGIAAVKAGYLAGLLPDNFESRINFVSTKLSITLPNCYYPFTTGFDLFGDSSIIGVDLPGHVIGQLGIFLTDKDNQSYFLIADACWLSRAYQDLVMPSQLTNLILADRKIYKNTLAKIHELHKNNPHLKIIPTHCQESLLRYCK